MTRRARFSGRRNSTGWRAKRRAAKEPPSFMPWHCVILAVDTAARSGWALRLAGQHQAFGEVDTLDTDSVSAIVQCATRKAELVHMPVVLVLEAPWGGSVWTITGLGQARERWLHAWRLAGQSARRVVSVQPAIWRAAVLGRRYASTPRDETRAYEQQSARWMIGERTRADESAAIGIGWWAAHAAQVGKVIGKRARAASRLKWEGASCGST